MIIRPTMLYASPAWSGMVTKTQVAKLQKIQNKCQKMALGANMRTKITTLYEMANVQNIEEVLTEHGKKFYNNLNIEDMKYINMNKENTPYKIKFSLPQIKYIN